jgi:hypothetical protein
VSDGGIFGVEGKNLRIDPFVLKERGHYIIHPLKYGYHSGSVEISEFDLYRKLADIDEL